jgi:hypothetical protein
MRVFAGTQLFRIAGRPIFVVLSGNVHFPHGGLVPLCFWFGFFVGPFILVWLLK